MTVNGIAVRLETTEPWLFSPNPVAWTLQG